MHPILPYNIFALPNIYYLISKVQQIYGLDMMAPMEMDYTATPIPALEIKLTIIIPHWAKFSFLLMEPFHGHHVSRRLSPKAPLKPSHGAH